MTDTNFLEPIFVADTAFAPLHNDENNCNKSQFNKEHLMNFL